MSKIEWPALLRGANLPHAAFRVAIVVWTYTGADGTGAFPGNRRIAQDANVSVSTAKRHLAALRDEGWLIRDAVGGMGTYPSGGAERYSSVYRLGPGPLALKAGRGRTGGTGPASAPPDAFGGSAGEPSPGSPPHPQGAHGRAPGGVTSGPGVGSPVGHQQVMDQVIDQVMDQDMHQGMSSTRSPTSFAVHSEAFRQMYEQIGGPA
ncbi:helix-turn-helix domain-containing protein [Brachybacterium muris]|uniref:helix-turn-helix domain-containing protein n=1 Tax=Brachybacterium muris TaxID=219301 RepID=UPI00167FCEBB